MLTFETLSFVLDPGLQLVIVAERWNGCPTRNALSSLETFVPRIYTAWSDHYPPSWQDMPEKTCDAVEECSSIAN